MTSPARRLLNDHMFASEKKFQAAVRTKAEDNGWLVYAVRDSRQTPPGWPDLTLVRGKQLIFWELKMPTGVVSDAQRKWAYALQEAGVTAEFMYPKDWDEICQVLEAPA